jgi:hypothetical protein
LLRQEIQRRERAWRKQEKAKLKEPKSSALDKSTNSTKLRTQ